MLPASLQEKIRVVWGRAGEEWIDSFDALLADIADRWQLSAIKPFADLSYNFVASAMRNGERVVLKLSPSPKDLAQEARALQAFDGRGVARLLMHEDGALLLEHLDPGDSLWQTWTEKEDDEHTAIAAHLTQTLWRPAADGFPTTQHWFTALEKYQEQPNQPLPKLLIDKAIELSRDLDSQLTETVLLHGDLHHGNILSHNNEYKAIDPKGVIGDKAFEAGTWIRNPSDRILQTKNLKALIDRRLRIISEITQQDLQKLKAWSFCACLLSAVWSNEDEGSGWEEAIACAEALD